MHETKDALESAYPNPHPLLLELEQYAHKENAQAVPRSLGRLLSTLVHGMQANRILEIGTSYGYATLWMALAQPPIGKIWTFDPDIPRTQIALSYFQRAHEDDNIEIFNQPALDVLPIFPQRNMDLVFVDSPAEHYSDYLRHCLPLLKLYGFLVFNNLLAAGTTQTFVREFLHHPSLAASVVRIGGGVGIGARTQ
jgi:predicted O-methyltransferase YrrM